MVFIAAAGARGQAITQPPPPGGGATFGPLNGAQSVRDGTAPQSVTHPGGNPTIVNPGDNIGILITAAGAGGTLFFTKGTHVNTTRRTPLAGQTFVFESAAGFNRTASDSAVIDGQDSNFDAHFLSSASNITFRGGVLMRQGYTGTDALGIYPAAIVAGEGASNWLIEDMITKDNRNSGINLDNANTGFATCRRVYATNNGRYGIGGGGILDKCRISHNNAREIAPGSNSSGTKANNRNDVRMTDCWAHDNRGFGLWIDTPDAFGGHWINNNVAENNWRPGIFMEGADGGCKIQRNYCINNGKDVTIGGEPPSNLATVQMQITNADQSRGSGVRGDVSRNDVDWTRTPGTVTDPGWLILLWNHEVHPFHLKNWDIHDNRFWLRKTSNVSAIAGRDSDTTNTTEELWNMDVDFFDNEYHVASTTVAYWQWGSGTEVGSNKTRAEWLTFHPGDDAPLVLI